MPNTKSSYNLFYEIKYILNKKGINPDKMELDEVFWMMKKISDDKQEIGCPFTMWYK